MSVYSDYSGQITFSSKNEASLAKKMLVDNEWMKEDCGYLVWLDESNEPMCEIKDTDIAEFNIMGDIFLILTNSSRRNIHKIIDFIMREYEIDTEATYYRSTCTDGTLEASYYEDGELKHLTEEELAQIKVDYVDEFDEDISPYDMWRDDY